MYSIYSLALLCFTTTTSMAFKPGIIPMKPVIKEVGVTLPFREKFDPLHLSDNVSDSEFARLRESELKHGRWAMISATTIPLIESFTHRPAIHEFDNLQPLQQRRPARAEPPTPPMPSPDDIVTAPDGPLALPPEPTEASPLPAVGLFALAMLTDPLASVLTPLTTAMLPPGPFE